MAAQAWHEEQEGSRNHQRPARGEAPGDGRRGGGGGCGNKARFSPNILSQ